MYSKGNPTLLLAHNCNLINLGNEYIESSANSLGHQISCTYITRQVY